MDERDMAILKAIADCKTGNLDEIADYTDVPKSTVHYRINNMIESGVITDELYNVNLAKIGFEITIITEVIAEYDEQYHKQVGEKLADVEGVNQVYFTMGDTDFIVIAHATDREMVHQLISDYESIGEIVRTSSQFVIESVKDEPTPLSSFELDTLTDVIDG